ncbi:DUF202 domain-containing protein [Streptomyces sp. NPDC058045]|uniref:DUF202 domain-containing protein n=1 Tax=Streptomyces sp. NPDC058045 TaxID=3346311 RepID=UPI0036E03796
MTPPAARPDRDPGLQPERTRLAWRRTTLACTVAGVLAAKACLRGGLEPVPTLAGGVCLLLIVGFLAVADRRIRRLAAPGTPRPFTPRTALLATACTIAMACCAAALVL